MMMLILIKLLLSVISLPPVLTETFAPVVRFRIKAVKCENVDPELYNGTIKCFIKPTRDGTGETTMLYTFGKPCNDAWVHLWVMYRYTGQYRQWMVNVDEDVCSVGAGTANPGVMMRLLKAAFDYAAPGFWHACPYTGLEGIKAVNIDKLIGATLPQVIPRGEYRFFLRMHTKSNHTFILCIVSGVVEAIRPIDNIQMG